jgi:hypothetical protein
MTKVRSRSNVNIPSRYTKCTNSLKQRIVYKSEIRRYINPGYEYAIVEIERTHYIPQYLADYAYSRVACSEHEYELPRPSYVNIEHSTNGGSIR